MTCYEHPDLGITQCRDCKRVKKKCEREKSVSETQEMDVKKKGKGREPAQKLVPSGKEGEYAGGQSLI